MNPDGSTDPKALRLDWIGRSRLPADEIDRRINAQLARDEAVIASAIVLFVGLIVFLATATSTYATQAFSPAPDPIVADAEPVDDEVLRLRSAPPLSGVPKAQRTPAMTEAQALHLANERALAWASVFAEIRDFPAPDGVSCSPSGILGARCSATYRVEMACPTWEGLGDCERRAW